MWCYTYHPWCSLDCWTLHPVRSNLTKWALGILLFACKLSLFSDTVPLDSFRVRCGDWDLKNEQEALPHTTQRIADITYHPTFNRNNLHDDVALIHVEQVNHKHKKRLY